MATSDDDLAALLDLAARAAGGACLRVQLETENLDTIKELGGRLARLFDGRAVSPRTALVLLTTGNIGKTLGQYATRWGGVDVGLIVIDEVSDRPAHFATIGQPHHGLVPVSLHGLESRMDSHSSA